MLVVIPVIIGFQIMVIILKLLLSMAKQVGEYYLKKKKKTIVHMRIVQACTRDHPSSAGRAGCGLRRHQCFSGREEWVRKLSLSPKLLRCEDLWVCHSDVDSI